MKGSALLMHPALSSAPQIVRIASRRAAAFGAASLAELTATALDGGIRCSAAEAREALIPCSDVQFLHDDWFWLPDRRNRLTTLTNRILAVAPSLDVTTIREGVCRTSARPRAAFVPPVEVMAAFYRAHPSFELDTPGRVRPVRPLDYRAELGKTDLIFVEALRSSWTGVLDRAAFCEASVARGMAPVTFNARSERSAVLDHPAADIWCLRGTRVSSITAAALQHAKAIDDS